MRAFWRRERRFARHVRTGHHSDPAARFRRLATHVSGQLAIVRHKGFAPRAQSGLNHGMAAADDLESQAVINFRADPIGFCSRFRQGRDHVHGRQGFGYRLDFGRTRLSLNRQPIE